MDNVTCTNCDWEGQVNCGEEICPNCHETGRLRWTDDEAKETDEVS